MTSATVDEAARFAQLQDLFLGLGYDTSLLANNYKYQATDSRRMVDFAAFAQLPMDMSSAVMVGQVQRTGQATAVETALGAASFLAVPAAVVAGVDNMEIFAADRAELVQRVPYGERPSDRIFDQLRADRLLQAKLRRPSPTLFSVDVHVLTRARKVATNDLRERVIATREAIEYSAHQLDFRLTPDSIARLLVDALTSLFIEDKFAVEYRSPAWWQEVQTRFRDLNHDLESFSAAAEALFKVARDFLREGVDYRSLDSVVIADLYEPRLVDPGDRNENGVVYTPFELATRVIERVPVELLDPSNRSVLDFACGSGTLLLASHDRLTGALPRRYTYEQTHQYLVDNLNGWDRDAFAVRLTHLSLTLKGFPLGNGWNIQQRDSLDPFSLPERAPSILVANPPWGARRSGNQRKSRSRDDAVTPFILRALNLIQPGGLLSLFLPASWLTAVHGASSRELVASKCDILEVWRLPEGAFPPAQVKGAVLIAQAKKPSTPVSKWYVARRVNTLGSLDKLYADGTADRTTLLQQIPSSDAFAASSPVTNFINNLRTGTRLDAVANLRSGPPRGSGAFGGQLYRWMGNVRLLDHFGRVNAYNTQPAMYPADFDAAAAWSPEQHYAKPKLLVSRVRRSNSPWKVKVGFAFEPVIPSNNQYAITLREDVLDSELMQNEEDCLYALGGILGSGLIAAWVDDQVATGNIPSDLIKRIPLAENWLSIAPQVRNFCEAVDSNVSSQTLSELARAIDENVFDLYKVPIPIRRDVIAVLAGESAPERAVRYEGSDAVDNCTNKEKDAEYNGSALAEHDGSVLEVDENGIRVWVDQVTDVDGMQVAIPQRLPAAALLPGITFVAKLRGSDIDTAEFRFHRSLYLDANELMPSAEGEG